MGIQRNLHLRAHLFVSAILTPIFCASNPAFAENTKAAGGNPLASHFGGARAKAVGAVGSSGRLGAAQMLVEAQEYNKAIEMLKGSSRAVKGYRALLLAKSLAGLGEQERALAALSEVVKPTGLCEAHPSTLLYDQSVELRVSLLEEKAPDRGAKLLLSLPVTGARLHRAAQLFRAADKVKEAVATETRLLVEIPESEEAKQLGAALGAALFARRLRSTVHRMSRIRNLLAAHENDSVARETQALMKDIGPKNKFRCELLYMKGKAERKRRKYSRAAKALSQARKVCLRQGQLDFGIRSALIETRVRAIRSDVQGVRRLVRWMQVQAPGHSYIDDGLFILAFLLERDNQAGHGEIYQEIMTNMPESDHAPKAAWRLALGSIRSKRNRLAQEILSWILSQKHVSSDDRLRAQYWNARLGENTRERSAKKQYEELSLRPSFYAWLTLNHLGQNKPKWARELKKTLKSVRQQRGAARRSLPQSILGSKQFARAKAYDAAQATDFAVDELMHLTCQKLSSQEVLAVAFALDALGEKPEAQRLIRSKKKFLLAEPVNLDTRPIWEVAYSKPFIEEIEKVAELEKVAPLMLTALVREESTFDPDIVSWAGAVGLAQLMPATAMGAFPEVFEGKLEVARLTEPALNLRLGARVLKDQLRAFEGVAPLAVAAYNSGAGTVRRFTRKKKPFELWVEEIPIKETRRYVKRVIESWGIYEYLYSKHGRVVPLPHVIDFHSQKADL